MSIDVGTGESVDRSNTKSGKLVSSFLRPAIASALVPAYFYFVKKQSPDMDVLMNSGLMFGSVAGSEMVSKWIMPEILHFSSKGLRSMEQMLLEPLITGALYSTGYGVVFKDKNNDYQHNSLFGAGVDLASGIPLKPIHELLGA